MTHVQKETAQLLKEKGFDVETIHHYYEDETISEDGGLDNYNRYKHHWISAPTLHEAADWLRTKGVHVSVVPVNLWQQWRMFIYLNTYPPQKTRLPEKPMDYKTHDLAIESGIVHALKHYVK